MEISTGKKHFTPGKKSGKVTSPSPQKYIPHVTRSKEVQVEC